MRAARARSYIASSSRCTLAALRPWYAVADNNASILIAHGLLRQYRHDFDGALDDLGAAAKADPEDPEPHAWRAAIYMVRAEYAAARRECDALVGRSSDLHALGCTAYVDATTGHARAAYAALADALARDPGAAPGLRLWTLTRLAEIAGQPYQRPRPDPPIVRSCERMKNGRGLSVIAVAELVEFPCRPGRGRRFGVVRDGRRVQQWCTGMRFKADRRERDDHRSTSREGFIRGDKLGGNVRADRFEFALQAGLDQVGGVFQPVPDLLSRERLIQIEHAPAKPDQGCGGTKGDREKQR